MAIGAADCDILLVLRQRLPEVFAHPAAIGRALPDYGDAYNPVRRQTLATFILNALEEQEECLCCERVLGIVESDLYIPGLLYAFGAARGRVAVISLCRLRPSFYRLPPDREVLRVRALTEAVHELGHTFGLGHCRNPACAMFMSDSIGDTDRKRPAFCPGCQSRLFCRSAA